MKAQFHFLLLLLFFVSGLAIDSHAQTALPIAPQSYDGFSGRPQDVFSPSIIERAAIRKRVAERRARRKIRASQNESTRRSPQKRIKKRLLREKGRRLGSLEPWYKKSR